MSPLGTAPAVRLSPGMVWSDAADGFYIFAGFGDGQRLNDLWLYGRQAPRSRLWGLRAPGQQLAARERQRHGAKRPEPHELRHGLERCGRWLLRLRRYGCIEQLAAGLQGSDSEATAWMTFGSMAGRWGFQSSCVWHRRRTAGMSSPWWGPRRTPWHGTTMPWCGALRRMASTSSVARIRVGAPQGSWPTCEVG